MQAPNVVSVGVIVGVIALCQGLAETLPVLGQPWVPFAVIALGALVKGLQVILQDRQPAIRAVDVGDAPVSKARRWVCSNDTAARGSSLSERTVVRVS